MKSRQFVAAALGVLFGAVALVHADADYKGKTEIGVRAGELITDGGSDLKSKAAFGFSLGQYVTDDVEVEASVLSAEPSLRNVNSKANVLAGTLEGQYHFGNGALRPFLALGVGKLDIQRHVGTDQTDDVIEYGAGLKWLFHPNFAARIDARHMIDVDRGQGAHSGVLTAGLSWLFDLHCGCSAPEPEKPAAKAVPENKWVLEGVQFETSSDKLTQESMAPLNEAIEILKTHKKVRVEIQGYTDNVGEAAFNQALSERRAISVKNYLVSNGIAADRLATRGYGETDPISENTTPEGRAKNRRIEFKVLSR